MLKTRFHGNVSYCGLVLELYILTMIRYSVWCLFTWLLLSCFFFRVSSAHSVAIDTFQSSRESRLPLFSLKTSKTEQLKSTFEVFSSRQPCTDPDPGEPFKSGPCDIGSHQSVARFDIQPTKQTSILMKRRATQIIDSNHHRYMQDSVPSGSVE